MSQRKSKRGATVKVIQLSIRTLGKYAKQIHTHNMRDMRYDIQIWQLLLFHTPHTPHTHADWGEL